MTAGMAHKKKIIGMALSSRFFHPRGMSAQCLSQRIKHITQIEPSEFLACWCLDAVASREGARGTVLFGLYPPAARRLACGADQYA
jgi:hypothetical protein